MKSSEQFALDQHLSFYPNDESFQGVLEIIRGKRPGKFTPWEPFLNLEPKELVMMIANMSVVIEREFMSLKELVTIIDHETIGHLMEHNLARKVDRSEVIRVCGYLDSVLSFNLPKSVIEALDLLKIK